MIGIFYQPSSESAKKIEWIEKIDTVLSSIKTTWDSTTILTSDTNIDLLSSSTTWDMYEQMLHRYQLSCHITKLTRMGKKLIDHISSNICKNKILHSDVLPCPAISDHHAPTTVLLFLSWKGIYLTNKCRKKRIVTLMYNLAFDFINCVCFPARPPAEEFFKFFFLCKWCNVMLSFQYY